MRENKGLEFTCFKIGVLWVMMTVSACKKEVPGSQKIKPPVRSYVVTARIDKKGTNTDSEGKAVLKGSYDEGTKVLKYKLEYEDIVPEEITLRTGVKGSKGTLIRLIYQEPGTGAALLGEIALTPLQERNLLKGYWFVSINTQMRSPDISGVLTLKQS